MSQPRYLVVCVGNALIADDRVGPEAFERLKGMSLPPNVRLVDLALGGINLLDELEGDEELIVVDAVQLGQVPIGHVHIIDWNMLPKPEGPLTSLHGIGLREAMMLCEKLYPEKMPKTATLIGVEGKCFSKMADHMSPEVMEGVDRAVEEVLLRFGES